MSTTYPHRKYRLNPTQKSYRLRRLGFALMMMTLAAALTLGAGTDKNDAIKRFDNAIQTATHNNEQLNSAMSDLENLMQSDSEPLDSNALTNANAALLAGRRQLVTIPRRPLTAEGMDKASELLDAQADIDDTLSQLQLAKEQLSHSQQQGKALTNPSATFLINRLLTLEPITTVQSLSIDQQANFDAHLPASCAKVLTFSLNWLDEDNRLHDSFMNQGGVIEVYTLPSEARARNEALSQTETGTDSHMVLGSLVIRSTGRLSAHQQAFLNRLITQALTQ